MDNKKEYYRKIDRVFRLPRVWSNRELKKIAHLFDGDILNVSGWKDIDKEGDYYKNYFKNASSYSISNYKSEAKGFQGFENEFFLDLEVDIEKSLVSKYDVIFNHTVLEHVYDVHKAMENMCKMTNDIAIIVVPFLQVMHADYGDYWRFTPLAMKKMFEKNKMEMIYCSFNSHKNASVYLFCIATKNKTKWKGILPNGISHEDPYPSKNGFQNWVGIHAIQNEKNNNIKKNFKDRVLKKIKRFKKK